MNHEIEEAKHRCILSYADYWQSIFDRKPEEESDRLWQIHRETEKELDDSINKYVDEIAAAAVAKVLLEKNHD